jgi:hypothetical protein
MIVRIYQTRWRSIAAYDTACTSGVNTVSDEIITPNNAPKIYIILFLKVSYMFRPCWAIFRENNIDKLILILIH